MPVHSYCFVKGLIFAALCGFVLICLLFCATVIAYWKQLPSLVFGFIVIFLLLIHFEGSVYDPPWFKADLVKLIMHL